MDLPCPPAAEILVVVPMGLQRRAQSSSPGNRPGFADRLATTVFGAPSLPHWCIWVEPLQAEPDRWSLRWMAGVEAAIDSWSALLPLQRVDDPSQAQIVVWRRRPPRRQTPTGWRASNGRSRFSIRELTRAGQSRREPRFNPRHCMSLATPLVCGDIAPPKEMPLLYFSRPIQY